MSAFARDDQGRLCAGGMPLGDIAASHGSPLYVYSGDGIRDDYRRFAAAVAPVHGSVHFALKANSALGVIGLLARHGAGADARECPGCGHWSPPVASTGGRVQCEVCGLRAVRAVWKSRGCADLRETTSRRWREVPKI